MKKSFLFLLALGGMWAHADLVIEQQMDSPLMKGKTVSKYKGEQMRTDMKGPTGDMTTIMDFKTGDMTMLMHAQKMVMKQKLNLKPGTGEEKPGEGAKVEPPKATGKKEKVGEWEAEIFEMTTKAQGQEVVTKMWVAKDFPNYKAIAEQMKKASAASAAAGGVDPSKFDLGGMVVKTEMNTQVGKVTTTLVKVTDATVDASEFTVPADYKPLPGQ